jgi:hypothetical protein
MGYPLISLKGKPLHFFLLFHVPKSFWIISKHSISPYLDSMLKIIFLINGKMMYSKPVTMGFFNKIFLKDTFVEDINF